MKKYASEPDNDPCLNREAAAALIDRVTVI